VDTNSVGMAAYERVAESIREDIRRGDLRPGDKLPGNRALAEQYDVALGTAQKALRQLQDERWLTASPSVGVFVNEPPTAATQPDTLASLAAELTQLQAALEDLRARIVRLDKGS
jgi:GntR family transcriptional regulator